MATESPIRMPGTSGKWPSIKEASTFALPTSAVAEDLRLLLKDHRFHGISRDAVPNRSGSAPPSMEGSFLAIGNLISQQDVNLNENLESLNNAIANCESEEQLRADPAYLAYYSSNVKLNPRLPPPLTSWENRRLVRHIDGFHKNWGTTSVEGKRNSSLLMSQGALSTHKEECEDDRSSQQPLDDCINQSSGFWPEEDVNSLPGGEHKQLLHLLQENLPIDPPSVYTHSHSLSHNIIKEAMDDDVDSGPLNDLPVSTSKHVTPVLASVSRYSSLDCTGSSHNTPSPQKESLNNAEIHVQDEFVTSGFSNSDISVIESGMNSLNFSSIPNSGKHNRQEQQHRSYENSVAQNQVNRNQSNPFQVQSSNSQMPSQAGSPLFVGRDLFLYGPSKFLPDQVLQSSGFAPPLYATAAGYATSANLLHHNQQVPALFPPLYGGAGGYPLNSAMVPPYMAGYPQGAFPFVFNGSGTPGSSFHAQTSDISTSGLAQHLNKFYGQLGFTAQPTYADRLYMPYYRQPFGQAYGMPNQSEPVASRGDIIGNQVRGLESQKGLNVISDDQKFQYQKGGMVSALNPERGGMAGPSYFESTSNMGILIQYPTQSLSSPVVPGSPVGRPDLNWGRNEMRFPQGHSRNKSVYPGWQGQREYAGFDDPKVYNFLEDLKSGKGRRFELSDIAGHIVEFSADQHGSRFIQQKLENCSDEEKTSVFKEVLPHAPKLMTDVFGNYVIQKFFEYGSSEQRRQLANQLAGQILQLSLQMYGCRVIQKALEVIEPEQKAQLIHELDGHVVRCIRDQNGNHVIQKCIESVPTDKIGFIISAFHGQVATLSMHPYGCRVVQRVLEHCTDEVQCQFIVDEILESVCDLAQDQYGNYVTQHVLERGKPSERRQMINKFSGHVVQLSQHKFASNVVEKCLEYGDSVDREIMIEEIVRQTNGVDNLLIMMKDQFANYVVQKVLETCPDDQREVLLGRIRAHASSLKKYTYGKHIAARFEHLYGEDQTPGS